MDVFENHSGLISFIALLITALFAIPAYLRSGPLPDLKEQIEAPRSRAALRDAIQTGLAPSYFRAIDGVTEWADGFYDKRLISTKAFDRCLFLAYLYPALAALIGWAIWNLHSPGGFALFPDFADPGPRLWRSAIILASAVGVYVFVVNYDWFERQTNALVGKTYDVFSKPQDPADDTPKWLGTLGNGLAFVCFVGICAALGLFLPRLFNTGEYTSFTFVLAGAAAIAIAGEVFITVPAVIGIAFLLYYMGATEGGSVVLFLFALLPVSNAIADMGSVAATRMFLRRIVNKKPGILTIVASLLLDLIVAMCFLVLLLWLITTGLDFWVDRFPQTAPLDWRTYLAGIAANPASGLALYLMLVTTLLPTALHLVAGIGALFTHGARLNARALRRLEEIEASGKAPEPAECTAIAKQLLNARVYGWALACGLLVAACYAATYLPLARLREVLDPVFGSG